MGRKEPNASDPTVEAYEKLYEVLKIRKGNDEAANCVKKALEEWRGMQELIGKKKPSTTDIIEKWKSMQNITARLLQTVVSLIAVEMSGPADADASSNSSSDSGTSSDDSSSNSGSESDSETPKMSTKVPKLNSTAKTTSKAKSESSSSGSSSGDETDNDSSSASSESDISSKKSESKGKGKNRKKTENIEEGKAKNVKLVENGMSRTSTIDSGKPTPPITATSASSSSSESSSSDEDSESASGSSTSDSDSESESKKEVRPTKRRKTETDGSAEKPKVLATLPTEKPEKGKVDKKSAESEASRTTSAVYVAETPSPLSPPATSTPLTNKKGEKRPRKSNTPFQRIKAEAISFTDERLKDNSFHSRGAGAGDYGERAHAELIVTRGDSFRKEKNKKKRGSYRGGEITLQSHSIKFT